MDDLNELDQIFDSIGGNDKAAEVASAFQNVEDGVYDAEIKKAEYKNSKKGIPMVQISYGLENGQGHNQFLMLASAKGDIKQTERNIATFATVMMQLGLHADKPSEYISQLHLLTGKPVTIELSTKNDFQRTSIIAVNGVPVEK